MWITTSGSWNPLRRRQAKMIARETAVPTTRAPVIDALIMIVLILLICDTLIPVISSGGVVGLVPYTVVIAASDRMSWSVPMTYLDCTQYAGGR